ncbi:hypothetical protein [Actinophytocola xinjiangensis]|nr:hypothetical protein [Actinophytocola xinjiangensis]
MTTVDGATDAEARRAPHAVVPSAEAIGTGVPARAATRGKTGVADQLP